MKYIVIGLGNFGFSIAEKLTKAGHEVIGVDDDMHKVEEAKEFVTHAICLDSSDPIASRSLPLKNSDVVIVCIGKNQGANILVSALMKKMQVKKLISRSTTPLHETVLEAMGVDEIIRPEEETAERWVKKLISHDVYNSFELTDGSCFTEIEVPSRFVGLSVAELNFMETNNIIVLSRKSKIVEKKLIGANREIYKDHGIAKSGTIFAAGDRMVIYGTNDDVKKFIQEVL